MTLHPVSNPSAASGQLAGPRQLLEDDPDGEAAPPYVMVPEIGLALWYDPQMLSEDKRASRDSIPRGIFQLLEGLPQPRPKVLP